MRGFLARLLIVFACVFCVSYNAHAVVCTSDQINTGNDCVNVKFKVTTTNLIAGDQFKFNLSARGTFYVDCGFGGELTSSATPSDVSGNKITRSNSDNILYTCTYSTGGSKTILFGGIATGYSINNVAAISFYNNATPSLLYNVEGSLGAVFPTLSDGSLNWQNPVFGSSFYDCANMVSISSELFNGIKTATNYMFQYTFHGCKKLAAIPSGLFDNISGNGAAMFKNTFSGCETITSIPSGLFINISGANQSMFENTFYGCKLLESIPDGLFDKIRGNAQSLFSNTFYGCQSLRAIPNNLFVNVSGSNTNMFAGTFQNCKALTLIPDNLFSGVTGNANYMFQSTFAGCSGLTSIPPRLFSGVTGGSHALFSQTFYNCSNITSIPVGLFSGVTSGAAWMFNQTFAGCSKLSGYITSSAFIGLITHNSPTASNMWTNTFANTKLSSTCPPGTSEVETTYKGTTAGTQWGNYAMCEGGQQSGGTPQYCCRREA